MSYSVEITITNLQTGRIAYREYYGILADRDDLRIYLEGLGSRIESHDVPFDEEDLGDDE